VVVDVVFALILQSCGVSDLVGCGLLVLSGCALWFSGGYEAWFCVWCGVFCSVFGIWSSLVLVVFIWVGVDFMWVFGWYGRFRFCCVACVGLIWHGGYVGFCIFVVVL